MTTQAFKKKLHDYLSTNGKKGGSKKGGRKGATSAANLAKARARRWLKRRAITPHHEPLVETRVLRT